MPPFMEQSQKGFKLDKMVKEEDIRNLRFKIKTRDGDISPGSTDSWHGDLDNAHDNDLELPSNARSNKKNGRDTSDDDDVGRDTFMDDIYDIVDSVVPKTDNVNTPALTFRVVIMGVILLITLSIINTLFTFRTNEFFISPLIGVLLSYPLGTFLSKILPRTHFILPFSLGEFTLNPGPFSLKEHALLYIISSAAANPAYALYNIIAQRRIQGDAGMSMTSRVGWSIAFAVGAQMIGYGMAGLCRRFLVRPAAMLWPANLSIIAILTSLHAGKKHVYATWEEEDEAKAAEEADKPVWRSNNNGRPASWASMESVDERRGAGGGWGTGGRGGGWQAGNAFMKDEKEGQKISTEDEEKEEAKKIAQTLRDAGKKKFKAFWIAAACMLCYQLGPSYLAPGLAAVSLMCHVVPNSQIGKMLGSARHGLGMFSLTFDWTIITVVQPITTPLWALLNQVFGLYIMLWIVIPLLWSRNAFGGDRIVGTNPLQGPNGTGEFPLGLAMNSAALFDKDGTSFDVTELLLMVAKTPTSPLSNGSEPTFEDVSGHRRHQNRSIWNMAANYHVIRQEEVVGDEGVGADNGTVEIHPHSLLEATMRLDEVRYAEMQPIRISTYFAVEYGAAFMAFTATLVHVWLWYGRDIVMRFRTSVRDLDSEDIHAKMMDQYPEVPDIWYGALLVVMTLLVLSSGQWGGIDLPWWSTILALLLISITMIPLGVIQAISGQSIGLNVISEFLAGWVLQGRMGSVMAFKTVAYMGVYQGLALTQDLKMGHYLKVPPRVLMLVQTVTTALTAVINVVVAEIVFVRFGEKIEGRVEGWDAVQYEVFMHAGAIWGLIGPKRFFGPGSPYQPLLLGFAIGAILPLIPYAFHRLGARRNSSQDANRPRSTLATILNPVHWPWHLVNVPLLVSFPVTVSSLRSDMISPIILAIMVNLVLKNYRPDWWRTYAYVMSAAFDSGAAVTITIIFLAAAADQSGKMFSAIPFHPLNRFDLDGCAPDYYIKCTELMITSGINATLADPDCMGFGTLGLA
ncbi:hypothetical protein HDU67_001281 [Dinochytrium kinnereticum]|nr:hypothetical protein HDU67_001281 [Dinochytrium kinnereticum]